MKPERIPRELDNDGVIFAYGSLLEHKTLRKLLKHRMPFGIFEASDADEAAGLGNANSADVIILRNIRLGNVRVSIVTETMLRRWYKNSGGDLQKLIDSGVAAREISPAVYLCARPAQFGEKGRCLNGGLICNLSSDDLAVLDKYEWGPVLRRTAAAGLEIRGRAWVPENITFYGGGGGEVTLEERLERAGFLNLNRKPGQKSPQARWPDNVRRRS